MSGDSDSAIDLNEINKPIYIDDIHDYNDKSGQEPDSNINNCISSDPDMWVNSNKKEIDYKKYFLIRSNRKPNDDGKLDLNNQISLNEAYFRSYNVTKQSGDVGDFVEKWTELKNKETKLFIDSIIASIILTHKYKYKKNHSIIACNEILNEINGCYCIFPFIVIDETSNDSYTETKYNILLPDRLKLLNIDIESEDEFLTYMFKTYTSTDSDLNYIDTDNFIDVNSSIAINDEITYTSIKSKIMGMKLFKNITDTTQPRGINFIDGINNIIDYEIYKKFIDILHHHTDNIFFKYIYYNSNKHDNVVCEVQYPESNDLNNTLNRLNPLHIIPDENKISELHREIKTFIQDKINNLYNYVPKINDTMTKFVYKKMIINSIYFTVDTYRNEEGTINSAVNTGANNKYYDVFIKKKNPTTIYNNINGTFIDNEKLVLIQHYDEDKDKLYYHFTIDVAIPICNTGPIRRNVTDVLLSNNLIVIILSYLITILIHSLISCCLEFWLKYGVGNDCIWITDTCKNIGNNLNYDKNHPDKYSYEEEISLIDWFFRYRLYNFPYQPCARENSRVLTGGGISKRYFGWNDTNTTGCISEDTKNQYPDGRPFPYNLIDYGENNFNSESIKYLFRIIVIFILCLLLPLRFIFNKCFGNLSSIYINYISKNKLISSIIFVLLPILIPLIALLILVSLAFSMILFLIYIVIAFIHNFLALIVPPIRYAKEIPNKFFSLLGIICSLTTFILIAVSILRPTHADGRVIFEGFHKLPTLAKFFILFGLIIVGFMIYGFKSISYPNSGITNDIEYNKSMDWLYNILLSPFDYKKLNEKQKNEFKNYRINHSVFRDSKNVIPLGNFLKTENFKVSILKLLLVLTVLAVVFYMVEKKGDNDKAFIWILGFLMFFSIRALLTHGLNKYITEYMKQTKSPRKYAYINTINMWWANRPWMHWPLVILATIAFGIFGGMSMPTLNGDTLSVPPIVGSVNSLINNQELLLNNSDTEKVNNFNILSKDILDLSEFLMLFKKTIYLICVCVILFFTTLTLPFVLIITLLYIILRLLYIFISIPFIKGGNYFFKIMKDRYKILAYMLCIAVILNIHDRDIFSHNTKTVVLTMSGILGLIIIYNFVNE